MHFAPSTVRVALAAFALAALVMPTARADDQPPVKVGVITTYSAALNAGLQFDAAFAAFVDSHTDSVGGRKIELIKRDDTGMHPDVAKRLADELVVEDHVDYLAGVALTPNAIAVSAVSAASKVPFLIANAATSNIFANDPYTARFGVTEAQLVVPLAQWALHSGIKTAYIIVLDYGPGLDGGATFSRTFTAGGGQIVGEVHIPVGNMDYSAYMQRIKDANPQAVYAFVNADGGAPFLKAFHESGLAAKNVKVLTTEDMVLDDYLPSLGSNAIGVISAGNYSSTHYSKLNREFVAAYKRHFHNAPPNFLSVAAYDCLNAIYRSVAALHGTSTPEKTMAVIRAMKFESPRGPLEIDPQTRDTVQNVYIRRTEIRNGVLQNTEFETIPMVKDPNEHYTTP